MSLILNIKGEKCKKVNSQLLKDSFGNDRVILTFIQSIFHLRVYNKNWQVVLPVETETVKDIIWVVLTLIISKEHVMMMIMMMITLLMCQKEYKLAEKSLTVSGYKLTAEL